MSYLNFRSNQTAHIWQKNCAKLTTKVNRPDQIFIYVFQVVVFKETNDPVKMLIVYFFEKFENALQKKLNRNHMIDKIT